MKRIFVIASAALVLIASGVVHGVWTDRWSDKGDLSEATERLERLPLVVGDWHGNDIDMQKNPNSGLAGMIARRYVHGSTGKVVTLLLACGRPGPVCTHTPDVCYASSGYETEKPKRFQLTSASAQAPPEFWAARFIKERSSGNTTLRVFWSWHGSEGWRVADNPRLSFAGEGMLYKMYLIREMLQADEPLEGDACVEFMHAILPTLQSSVLAPPSQNVPSRTDTKGERS